MPNIPLTKPQRQILRLEQYTGGPVSNLCGAVFPEKNYGPEPMRAALCELLRRNDSLRLSLTPENPEMQAVREYSETEVGELSFSSAEEFRGFAEIYGKTPMNTERALAECRVIRLPEQTGVLIKVHHLAADAWTMAFLVQQLFAILEGEEPENCSYLDWAAAEENYRNSPQYAADLRYFRETVAEYPERTFLKQETGSGASAQMTFPLDPELVRKVREFAGEQETTPFAFWLTVLGILVYRICGTPKSFYLGVPVLNRIRPEDFRTAGMFVNNVPVRMALHGECGFLENLTESVEENWYRTLRHQKCNYTDVLEQLGSTAERLYDLLFSFQSEQYPDGIGSLETFYNGAQPENLQIHLESPADRDEARIRYEYQTELFSPEEIRNLHRMLTNLAENALADSDCPVCELPLESEQEHLSVLLPELLPALSPETVCDRFETQAERNPDGICLRGKAFSLTWREFHAAVVRLDAFLRRAVPQPGTPVAVLFDRCPEMYIAIYAVLRSGNAFVPIDPASPPERICALLEESGAGLLLAEALPEGFVSPVPAYCAAECLQTMEKTEIPAVPPLARPDGIAYILFTSGSTGKPKGACIRHDSLRNRLEWMQKCYPLSETSVILQKTPYTFDVSVWEILWWGISGGALAVPAPGEHFLPEKIAEDIRRYRVTHIHFVPSVFRLFTDWLEEHPEYVDGLSGLEHVFLSGEAAVAEPLNRFRKLLGTDRPAVHNLYGPTECAIDVTAYDCRPYETDPIPIGSPVDRTSIYLVDEQMRPVPRGTAGELLIGGIQVGTGYVNQPELTGKSFPENPFGEGRVYRTGDIAVLREDGMLLYRGRRDAQFKLNGRRIEPGEIESVLDSHPDVTSAAVYTEKSGEREILCACYAGAETTVESLRAYCLQKLPANLVPSVWYYVSEPVLNRNGKTDRSLLMNSERRRCISLEKPDLPESPLEESICRQFSELLHTEIRDRNADFLLLGGGSLDVICLLSRPEYAGISAADFLANPTPAALAGLLKRDSNEDLSFLHTLYRGEPEGKAVVFFPFAGGDAAAFTALTAEIRKRQTGWSVCCADYPHSEADCLRLAEEIRELGKTHRLVFYSHCVGAAPAVRVLAELERSGCRSVERYLAAALIPPAGKREKRNLWRYVPDGILTALLRKAGAPVDVLIKQRRGQFLNTFRADTDYYWKCISGASGAAVKCPAELLFAEKDFFTGKRKNALKNWAQYCENIEKSTVLQTSTHYFQTALAEQVAEQICREETSV